jgi:hypothetical protein
MKAFLMHRDEDFDVLRLLPPNEEALTQDLELDTLFDAMAAGDDYLRDVARIAVLGSLGDQQSIVYRQHVLADCLEQPEVVLEIYAIAVEAIRGEKRDSLWRDSSSGLILSRSIRVLELFVALLKRLRQVADEHAGKFQSDGFVRFFAMLTEELGDEYLATLDSHLNELAFRHGTLLSAELGGGNKGANYVLREPWQRPSWIKRFSGLGRPGYSFRIADRDEAGFKALSDLRAHGINLVANAAAQSTDHLLAFFTMLRAELAFYIGCQNLRSQLAQKSEPTCFPSPASVGEVALSATGLYDPSLALHFETRIVGNDLAATGKSLVMITGANQGGKSTFLKSIGLAQLMMQCGMFVAAESFGAGICDSVFTHFKREEDASMESGKLDEELGRMSEIADQIRPRAMLLCNESFASTNEREGSEIARQIVRALVENGVRAFFVTHLFDLAHGLYLEQMDTALFLRAERRGDGQRTFRLVEGEPLPTSYGEDSYRRIFGSPPSASPQADSTPQPASQPSASAQAIAVRSSSSCSSPGSVDRR